MCPIIYGQAGGSVGQFSLGEREALLDLGLHRLVDEPGLTKVALTLRVLGGREVTQTWLTAQDLARPGYFKPLGRGFLRLATCDGSRHGAGKLAVEPETAINF